MLIAIKSACSSCGRLFEKEVPQSVNVSEEPSLKEAVLDGSLFTWECPHCGAVNMIRPELLYHDPDAKIMIWLVGDEVRSSRAEELLEAIGEEEALSDYSLRRVSEPGALIEKVKIADLGLDDVAVELCKYVTAMELSSGEKDGKLSDALSAAQLRLRSMDGADGRLTFVFPLEGAMHSVSVGFNVYEDCHAILARNPGMRPAGVFPKVDGEWVRKNFR